MARALNTDYLQNFAFSVRDVSRGGLAGEGDPFDFNGGEDSGVGFSTVSGLTIQAELYSVNEGTFPFPRNVIRRASVSSVTLRRGMAPRDSDFYNWFNAALFGDVNVRKTLLVTMNRRTGAPVKAWLLHECIPTRVMCMPDLDATSPEIAVAELEVQPTYVEEFAIDDVTS